MRLEEAVRTIAGGAIVFTLAHCGSQNAQGNAGSSHPEYDRERATYEAQRAWMKHEQQQREADEQAAEVDRRLREARKDDAHPVGSRNPQEEAEVMQSLREEQNRMIELKKADDAVPAEQRDKLDPSANSGFFCCDGQPIPNLPTAAAVKRYCAPHNGYCAPNHYRYR